MTMTEIQRKLASIVVDLDAVAQEVSARGMGEDWIRLEDAITKVGQVCGAFLDEKTWHAFPQFQIARGLRWTWYRRITRQRPIGTRVQGEASGNGARQWKPNGSTRQRPPGT